MTEQKANTGFVRYIGVAEAAAPVARADRILVIGCSGGGKSTLSQKIAARFGQAYFSIDRDVLWLPGWKMREKPEQRRRIEDIIAQDRWILDGTSPSSFDIRVPRSDMVIWVRMPRLVNIWGILSRWVRHAGKSRPEMAPGCPEKMDWEFLRYVWTFEAKYAPKVTAELHKHIGDTPVLVLKSRRETRELLDLLAAHA